ncbi:MAG: hypothetical protein ACF8LK_08775 [Phycisphaerales bacterium JB041]
MKTLSRALILALGVSAFGLAGCQTTGSSKVAGDGACCADGACDGACEGDAAATISQVSNETCPLSGGPVKASAKTVSFQGQEVGFCCGGCATKFEAMSDSDKMATLAK